MREEIKIDEEEKRADESIIVEETSKPVKVFEAKRKNQEPAV